MIKKLIKICLVALALNSSVEAKEDTYVSFVQQVSDEILNLLRKKSDAKVQERAAIKKIMEKYFNMDEIGKFVLGRHWRLATEDQRKHFLRLFRDVLAADYASQFDNYRDEEVIIQRSKPGSGGGVLVVGLIKRPSGHPIEVIWFLRKKDNKLQIFDVIIEGVSLSQTLRTEYTTRLSQSGGTIEGLLDSMKKDLGNPTKILVP